MKHEALDPFKRRLRKTITEEVDRRRYTLRQAGELAGVAPNTIGGLLNGTTSDSFTLDRLFKLAIGLGLKVEVIIHKGKL